MIRRDLWDIFVGYSIVEHCLDLVSKSKKAAMTHNPQKNWISKAPWKKYKYQVQK